MKNKIFQKWIKVDRLLDSCFVIKNINVSIFDKAYIEITGLGFYELLINNKRVDECFYKPLVSDYLSRDLTKLKDNIVEQTNHKIFYNVFNIKKYLKIGNNEIKILLGNGFYRQLLRLPGGDDFSFGKNLLTTFNIHIFNNNQEIIFSPSGDEIVKNSFITFNNIFYGEHHDYSLLNNDKTYSYELIDLKANIEKQKGSKDIIIRKIKPKLIYKDKFNYVYDNGENVSGIISFKGNVGNIDICFAEEINDDFSLNFESAGDPYNEGNQIHHNTYYNVEKEMYCYPYFSFTCFRYFKANKHLKNVYVNVIHSNVKDIGFVQTDDELINWYYDAFKRTMLNNMHYSFPSDCPHRERLGYTGDGQISSLISMMMFDARKFYRKWIIDIMDSQDIASGHIPHTAPFMGGGGGPSIWGGAIINVPYNYYLVYKDKSILKLAFKAMTRYIECMKTFLEDDLIVKERSWGWDLGDWCAPTPIKVPKSFVNSTYFVYLLNKYEKICKIVNKKYKYDDLVKNIKVSIDKHFLNKHTMDYCDNLNSANAYALLINNGNGKTLKNLENKFANDTHLNTGFAGTCVLSEVLSNLNPKLLYKIFSCISYPSFGYIKNKFKATTFYEGFAYDGSHSHHFQGGFLAYYLKALLKEEEKKNTLINNGKIKYIFNGEINYVEIKNNLITKSTKQKL